MKTEMQEKLFLHPVKKAALDSLPVASPEMTEDELRDLVVAYTALQASLLWTPSEDMIYHCPTARAADENGNLSLFKGVRYGGVPYSHAGRDLSCFFDFYDENTGEVNVKALGDHPEKVIGNDCANALFWGWARVSSSMTYPLTRYMLPYNGCLKLGPYTYQRDLLDFHDFSTKKICVANGKQVMFESYALLKRGDGLVLNAGRGHGMMAMEDAVVVRDENGEISEEESFVYILEQHSVLAERETEDGTVQNIGGVHNKKTFASLYKEGDIPFRIPELAGLSPVQKGRVKTVLAKGEADLTDVYFGTLRANYPISRVEAVISDGSGEICRRIGYGSVSAESRVFALADLHLPTSLPPEKVRLTVKARLGNGETLSAFDGEIRCEKKIPRLKKVFTKKDLDSLPAVKPGMKEEELRKIAADYAFLQASLPWTPSETVHYSCATAAGADGNGELSFHRGTIYGGVPYTHAGCDLYNFLDFCEEKTGLVETPSFGMGFGSRIGNNCASAVFWAWARVSSRLIYTYTGNMVPRNGCLKLGPYRYDTEIEDFEQYGTRRICKENGEQVMFESYALMQPGDGFVLSNNRAGHASMCYRAPKVVRNEDGTINGELSTIEIVEQHSAMTVRQTENGEVFNVGGAPTLHSFQKLFQLSDIPFTIPEFCDQKVEKVKFVFEAEDEPKLSVEEIQNAVLTCNYPISQVWLTITDLRGEKTTLTAYGKVKTARKFALAELGVTPSLPCGDLVISARASTGETALIYEGKIVRY